MYLSSLKIWLTREILDLKNEWHGQHNFYVVVQRKMKRHGYRKWGTHLMIQTKCVARHMRGTPQNIKMRHLNAWLPQLSYQGTAYAFRAFHQYRYHCHNNWHILSKRSIRVTAQKKRHGHCKWGGMDKEGDQWMSQLNEIFMTRQMKKIAWRK